MAVRKPPFSLGQIFATNELAANLTKICQFKEFGGFWNCTYWIVGLHSDCQLSQTFIVDYLGCFLIFIIMSKAVKAYLPHKFFAHPWLLPQNIFLEIELLGHKELTLSRFSIYLPNCSRESWTIDTASITVWERGYFPPRSNNGYYQCLKNEFQSEEQKFPSLSESHSLYY